MENSNNNWWEVSGIEKIDSPALLIYRKRIIDNIRNAIGMVKDVSLLRPHVKTNKMAEVCWLMMESGIKSFKCATIAEAEMLTIIYAPDVLLAYQPVGPKTERLFHLVKEYPKTTFSCLIDNIGTAREIGALFSSKGSSVNVYIDLNNGMNRTGIVPGEGAFELYKACIGIPGIKIMGLHAYDGHVKGADQAERNLVSDNAFRSVSDLAEQITASTGQAPVIIAGGSPSFSAHAQREHVQCSPGTFVFWDWGYAHSLPDQPFAYAALVITRVISIIDPQTICTDLGHKSLASENPLPRVHFLNAPDALPVGHSEEHMILKVADSSKYMPGDVLYGVPVHICPTVSDYEKAYVIDNQKVTGQWNVIARNRSIKI